MNINLRKDELIKEIDLNIKYLQKNRNNALIEYKKCLITILTTIDKSHYKYIKAKIKYIIGYLFSNDLTNNYLEILHDEVINSQEYFLLNNTKKTKETEKAYLSYWLNQINNYNKKIAYLKCQRKELKENILTKKNIYELGTLDEIDYYEKNKYKEIDTSLVNKGLIKYKIEVGYLANPKDVKEFIRELRNNFYYIIKNSNNISTDNISIIYNIAYQRTLEKFEIEPVIKPSMTHMLEYLQKNNKIIIDSDKNTIKDCTLLYQKYYNECFYLFTGVMSNIKYIDIDEVERMFNFCCNTISEEMNYYPEKPISLKKVLPKMVKRVQENKMQN